MSQFKHGDKVVHLGGVAGTTSRNRGKVLTIIDGPFLIHGYSGVRYMVDKPVYAYQSNKQMYHANEEHLLKLK